MDFSQLFDGYKLCISFSNKVNLSSSLFNFLSKKVDFSIDVGLR